MIKQLVIISAVGASLSGCSMITSLERNREAVDTSTCSIMENIQAIENANEKIRENSQRLDSINKELQKAGEG